MNKDIRLTIRLDGEHTNMIKELKKHWLDAIGIPSITLSDSELLRILIRQAYEETRKE